MEKQELIELVHLEKIIDELAIAAYNEYWKEFDDTKIDPFNQASDKLQGEWRNVAIAVVKKYEELKLQNPET